ncbi:MAG: RNA 2',3'-cyclic phosphodiesterase [Robiginitomaculum sp.]|nr:RNA 2',3'-cyclic phosphodiesterase [Robiginitomaculum sp.]
MLTLFAAIKPPSDILDAVEDVQKGIEGVNWTPRDNLHITVGYFGAVEDKYAEILDHELARSPGTGFDLRLRGADIFGNSRPHSLWLGVEKSPALTALHKHIRRAAKRSNIDMEARNFVPHLTLAYLRRHTPKDDLTRYIRRHIQFKPKPFLIDKFALYSSHHQKHAPNIYKKQANYPLLG